jgi:hypothetical protein
MATPSRHRYAKKAMAISPENTPKLSNSFNTLSDEADALGLVTHCVSQIDNMFANPEFSLYQPNYV